MVEQIISLFILIAGYIVGLGAVTVIDLHGFLGRKSQYWTRATIATHKITKPLIWLGTILVTIGCSWFYTLNDVTFHTWIHLIVLVVLMFNGLFLSFWVSPRLLQREKEGRAEEILPMSLQNMITVSFVVSFVGWWGSLLLFIVYLVQNLK